MTAGHDDVAERLQRALGRIAAAAERAGRSPAGITLVAVSKTFPLDVVRVARAAGQVDFGESRAQELQGRVRDAAAETPEGLPPLGARWHFVGRLQRNKVRDVVGVATLIHSVDRRDLAADIGARALAIGRVQRVLVQVDVDDDPAKAGVPVHETAALVAAVRELPGVAVEGLMAIPALDGDPRAAFKRLRALRDDLRERFPEVQHLSMGMSGDYEAAVEEGATLVRLGEAIFGRRSVPPG